MFTVQDMMTTDIITLSSKHTISDAKCLMNSKRIRHIPIVDEHHRLLGLITQRDVLAAQSSSLEKSVGGDDPMQTALAHFANRNLYTITPKAGLKAAALYMQKHKIGCLPVLDDNKLVGIMTDSDFVAIAINLLEIQEESEPLETDDVN